MSVIEQIEIIYDHVCKSLVISTDTKIFAFHGLLHHELYVYVQLQKVVKK